jgi:hypothetical protein
MKPALRLIVVVSILFAAARVEAIPAFARKYGMSCTACHVAWPILNQQGQLFRDNGYQFGLEKDNPTALNQAYIPISLRTVAAYQYTSTTNQTSDNGPITVKSGGVPLPPGIDVLTAGTIAKDISFLVVLTGFSPSDNASFAESAWVRLDNLAGTSWLNFLIGKFELDLPQSSHRNVTLTSAYAAYGPRYGSVVPFDMSENQVGVEVSGHDTRGATRYALSLVSVNGDPGGKGAWSSPLVYGHLQQAFDLDNPVLPWLRVGVFGATGWLPTTFSTDSTSGSPVPIAGTGGDYKTYSRYGAELTGLLGHPSTPVYWSAAWMKGQESADFTPGSPSPSFSGGWVEADWVPWSDMSYVATPWMFTARYDFVKQSSGPGDFTGVTVGARRYLAFGPRASTAIHVEYSSGKTKGASSYGTDVQVQAILAGIDFDY